MARLTRTEKLDRRGILHWEVDGVLARLTARQSKRADIAAKMKPIVGAGAILAVHIRDRMRRGQFAGSAKPRPYPTTRKHVISPEYARLAGVERIAWISSAAFHSAAGAKPGTGWVSGGMWSGVEVRGLGKNKAVLEFDRQKTENRGKVVSVNVEVVRGKDRHRRNVKRRWTLSSKAQNRDKAKGVLKAGVHVLEPKNAELDAIGWAVLAQAHRAGAEALQIETGQIILGGDPALARKLQNGWR